MNTQSASPKSHLRVGTFNVHGWTNGRSEDKFQEICSLLHAADLDIIGLQEASRARLPALVSLLGRGEYRLAAKFGGTAILTRLPIANDGLNGRNSVGLGRISCCSVILPGGTEEEAFSAVVIHLNHKKEALRLKEIRTIVEDLEKKGLPLFDLWMGDFNALTEADYSKEEWDHIFEIRNRNCWELPVTNLTSAMTSKPKTKESLWKGLGLHDAYTSVPQQRRSGPLCTCRFATRIDYVYFNAQRMNAAGWSVVACEHVDSKEYSDHNLVIATFKKNSLK